MSKDYTTKSSGSGDASDDRTGSQYPRTIVTLNNDLLLQQKSLLKEIEKLKKMMDVNPNEIACYETPQCYPSDLECPTSTIGLPMKESQNLSIDTPKIVSNSQILAGYLRRPKVISRDLNEMYDYCNLLAKEINQNSSFLNALLNADIFETMTKTQNNQFLSNNSSPKLSCYESQKNGRDTESDTCFKTIFDSEIEENKVGSSENSGSKGKEAKNPKYRYKKRSKSYASSCESLSKKPVEKHFNEACLQKDTPGQQDLESQLSKNELTRISPKVTHKELDSCIEDDDKQQLDKNFTRALPVNQTGDNYLKIAKKLKLNYDKKPSDQSLHSTTFLSLKNYDLSEYHADQNQNENKQFILPYSKDQTNVYRDIFTCKNSYSSDKRDNSSLIKEGESLLRGVSKDISLIESEDSLFTSLSGSVPPDKKGDLTLKIVSEDVPLSKSEDSLFTSLSGSVPREKKGDLSLKILSEDVPLSKSEETFFTSENGNVPLSEGGELSHKFVSEDVPQSKIEESFLMKASEDLSLSEKPLIASRREDESLEADKESISEEAPPSNIKNS